MVNVYEGMYIFDSNRFARDTAAVPGRVNRMIEKIGGEMLVSRLWDERRLAYVMKGHRKGTYWLTFFRADSNQLAALNRQCQINDDILRHLFVKIDQRIVDALVNHAKEDGKTQAAKAGSKTPAVTNAAVTAEKAEPKARADEGEEKAEMATEVQGEAGGAVDATDRAEPKGPE